MAQNEAAATAAASASGGQPGQAASLFFARGHEGEVNLATNNQEQQEHIHGKKF